MAAKGLGEEPVLGVPYGYSAAGGTGIVGYGHGPVAQPVIYAAPMPHQAGMIPPNAVFGDPKGIPLQQTMFRDTPAPFECVYCGSSSLTVIRSKPSLAAVVGCMMPFMLGVCFLCPSMDCLWHKYHYCPNCKEKVASFEKLDSCIVMDPTYWTETSYGSSSPLTGP